MNSTSLTSRRAQSIHRINLLLRLAILSISTLTLLPTPVSAAPRSTTELPASTQNLDPKSQALIKGDRAPQLTSATGANATAVHPAPIPHSSVVSGTVKHQMQTADDAYIAGARLLERKDFSAAEAQFAKAIKLNPRNQNYILALAITREHRVSDLVQQAGKSRLLGHNAAADLLIGQARALDPENAIVSQHIDPGPLPSGFTRKRTNEDRAANLSTLAGPIELAPLRTPQDFDLRGDIKQAVSAVAGKFEIRTVIDTSVPSQNIHFNLQNTTYSQAMPILLQMGHLFSVPLDSKSILIAKDSPENRQRLERLYEETISIPALTVEQMTELATVIRQIFDLRQVSVQNNLGTIVIRAPEYVLDAMNLTLADLIDGGAEVMLDLKLYSVDKSRTRNIGAQLPQQVGVYNVATAAQNLVSSNQALVNQAIASGLVPANASNVTIALALIASGLVQSALLTNTVGFFGGGITQTGVTTNANPTFSLSLNSSETRALEAIQLRTGNRQPATFRVGSRYPVTTSTYSYSSNSTTSSALSGLTINGVSVSSLLNNVSTATVPQIEYEDLGLTLKATPTVQKTNNVTVQLDIKIESLTGTSLNNIPVLTSRQFTSEVTVADGETALLLSGASKTESAAISGLPALSELPGFQDTSANKVTQQDSSDLVLLITPHIIRHRSSVIAGPRISLNLPSSE